MKKSKCKECNEPLMKVTDFEYCDKCGIAYKNGKKVRKNV